MNRHYFYRCIYVFSLTRLWLRFALDIYVSIVHLIFEQMLFMRGILGKKKQQLYFLTSWLVYAYVYIVVIAG